MSIEEFTAQYEKSLTAIKEASIDEANRVEMLQFLQRIRDYVSGHMGSETEGLELMQRLIVAVALEEGRTQKFASA